MNSLRHALITRGIILAVLLFGLAVRAQPTATDAKPPVTFRTFAVGDSLSALFYDDRGKPVAVSAGNLFSHPYTAPEGGRLALYRLIPNADPQKPPHRVPVATVTLGDAGPYFVFLTAIHNPADPPRPRVEALVIDDSWEQHPEETIRVVNFSRVRVAVKIGDILSELASAEHRLFPYPMGEERKIRVQAAALTPDEGWVSRISGLKQFKRGARSTFVITDQMPPLREGPSSRPVEPIPGLLTLRNLIDTTPPPPKP